MDSQWNVQEEKDTHLPTVGMTAFILQLCFKPGDNGLRENCESTILDL